MLESFLKSMGLTEKEALVFLSMLEIGTNAVNTIAQKANLSRTTVYSVLESLRRKGFCRYYTKGTARYYSAERPEIMISMLDRELRATNLRRRRFEELMPEFARLINRDAVMPKVRYFEGFMGIQDIYQDMLNVGEDKLSYSSGVIANQRLKDIEDEYNAQRIAVGLRARTILSDSQTKQPRGKSSKETLSEHVLVPSEKFPFKSTINIYGNRVALMSLVDAKPYGVIIESINMANTERSIFELAWLGAKSFA